MFQICTKTKTIQKISPVNRVADNETIFTNLDHAKRVLILAIQVEINGLKIQIKQVESLTIDDVSQLGFF